MMARSRLTKWFDCHAKLVARQLDISGPNLRLFLLSAQDEQFTESFRSLAYSMGIAYVSARPGSEANYIVFLTREMEKFHEVYLAE